LERLKYISRQNPDGITLFTLNIPGSVKTSPFYRRIFNQGISTIKIAFNAAKIIYNVEYISELATGSEAYLTVLYKDLYKVKKITSEIEETHPLGRIFDIDLYDMNLNQVKSGRQMRQCFVCPKPAFECSRSMAHSLDEVLRKIRSIAEEYFDSLFWKISSTATRAMISEVLVTPKPGLVDRTNTGSHSDMDIFTFTDSSTALTRTFYKMAQLGGNYNGNSLSDLLYPLRAIGIEGENEMYRMTGGVNTQKGLIFSIGILSAAAGYILCKSRDVFTAESVCMAGGELAANIISKDFDRLKEQNRFEATNGEKLYIKYGMKGARGEAEGGFRSALKALKILKLHIKDKLDLNKALAGTLISIIAESEDTNIPGRGSLDTLNLVRDTALSFVENGSVYNDNAMTELERIDADFIENRISPGGSADILAITIFLFFLENEFKPVSR